MDINKLKKPDKPFVVTAVIVSLIVLLAILLASTIISRKRAEAAALAAVQSGAQATANAESGRSGRGEGRGSGNGGEERRGNRGEGQGEGRQGNGGESQGSGERQGRGERQGGGNGSGERQSSRGEGQSGGRQGSGGSGGQRGSGGRNATVVRITTVESGTIENSVVINGDVLARNQVSIFPTVGGKLVEARKGIGDRVGRGDIVAMIDPSRPGEIYSHSPVISTVSGTVLSAPYYVGDTLTAQSAIFVVGDLSALWVETFVPERFVSSVRQGLKAQITLEAVPGETFLAEVYEVSPVLEPASRTLRIRLRFVDEQGRIVTDDRIKAGMFSTLSLVTRTRTDVPVIPRSSAINTYGTWIVFTVDENSIAHRHEVELGLENEEQFEIISGISLGDRVVSQGQNFLSDGDPVRIVE